MISNTQLHFRGSGLEFESVLWGRKEPAEQLITTDALFRVNLGQKGRGTRAKRHLGLRLSGRTRD